jgi:hypothetical protein
MSNDKLFGAWRKGMLDAADIARRCSAPTTRTSIFEQIKKHEDEVRQNTNATHGVKSDSPKPPRGPYLWCGAVVEEEETSYTYEPERVTCTKCLYFMNLAGPKEVRPNTPAVLPPLMGPVMKREDVYTFLEQYIQNPMKKKCCEGPILPDPVPCPNTCHPDYKYCPSCEAQLEKCFVEANTRMSEMAQKELVVTHTCEGGCGGMCPSEYRLCRGCQDGADTLSKNSHKFLNTELKETQEKLNVSEDCVHSLKRSLTFAYGEHLRELYADLENGNVSLEDFNAEWVAKLKKWFT